jgi:hypothetical protein
MITTITPLRRVAVTLVLTGATALGAVSVAPAAFADDTTTAVEQAPVVADAPEVVVPDSPAPVLDTPAPVVETPAPVAEQAPAPAPVVLPPPVVIGKDGKPVKQPKVCTAKDLAEIGATVSKAVAQAAPLNRAAAQLRQASALLRTQAARMTASQARITLALAGASDLAATKLEAQAQAIVDKASVQDCVVVTAPGGRF